MSHHARTRTLDEQAHIDYRQTNYGAFRMRRVARSDRPVNWFRRAPRAKSK
jgi:hypothetical protein